MKRIIYLYTGGREKRVFNNVQLDFAKDFFYGYHELLDLGYDVSFVERIIPQNYKPRNLRYRWLAYHNKWAASKLIMGNNAPFFLPHLDKIKQADIVIAIGDSIALAPEYYKLRGWIKSKIIHVSMGLANYWEEATQKGLTKSHIVKWYYNRLLDKADKIITLGVEETNHLKIFFPKQSSKISFVPFGVDTQFWQESNDIKKDIDVLFIGNDMRRDYELVEKLPILLPNLQFVFVSKHIKSQNLPDNVHCYSGSWRGVELSDIDIRSLYQRAKLLINPIKETLQPSGQSVTLQAMACGVPVLISKYKGFWEPENYDHKNIVFVNQSIDNWVKVIKETLGNTKLLKELSINGKKLTHEKYSSKKMVNCYIDIFTNL